MRARNGMNAKRAAKEAGLKKDLEKKKEEKIKNECSGKTVINVP